MARTTMQAYVLKALNGPPTDIVVKEVPIPELKARDLLVRNTYVALNPTDWRSRKPGGERRELNGEVKIVGRDAVGVVEKVGTNVTHFKVGDEVFYAGDTTRNGTFAQFTAVDERIVGKKPKTLTGEQAASLPLTALTAYEAFREHLGDVAKPGAKVLIYNGAGGVGSIAIQLAKHFGMEVIATASREETVQHCKEMGADRVINHRKPLVDQIGENSVDLVLNTHENDALPQLAKVVKPLGHICVILPLTGSDAEKPAYSSLFVKRLTLSFELMFTRPMLDLSPERQGVILNEISRLADARTIRPTNKYLFAWSDLPRAFDLLESGRAIGKLVVGPLPS